MVLIKSGSSAKWEMFSDLAPKVCFVFYDLYMLLKLHGVPDIIITSLIRPKENDSGVHALGRAIDVSVTNIPKELHPLIVEYINAKYPYDKSRPEMNTLIIHTGVGYDGDIGSHIHIQCS